MPCSWAARPAFSAATWAANGVDLREPLKPWPPELAHDRCVALPIGDRDDRVVERRMHVRDPVGNDLLDLLARALLCGDLLRSMDS